MHAGLAGMQEPLTAPRLSPLATTHPQTQTHQQQPPAITNPLSAPASPRTTVPSPQAQPPPVPAPAPAHSLPNHTLPSSLQHEHAPAAHSAQPQRATPELSSTPGIAHLVSSLWHRAVHQMGGPGVQAQAAVQQASPPQTSVQPSALPPASHPTASELPHPRSWSVSAVPALYHVQAGTAVQSAGALSPSPHLLAASDVQQGTRDQPRSAVSAGPAVCHVESSPLQENAHAEQGPAHAAPAAKRPRAPDAHLVSAAKRTQTLGGDSVGRGGVPAGGAEADCSDAAAAATCLKEANRQAQVLPATHHIQQAGAQLGALASKEPAWQHQRQHQPGTTGDSHKDDTAASTAPSSDAAAQGEGAHGHPRPRTGKLKDVIRAALQSQVWHWGISIHGTCSDAGAIMPVHFNLKPRIQAKVEDLQSRKQQSAVQPPCIGRVILD